MFLEEVASMTIRMAANDLRVWLPVHETERDFWVEVAARYLGMWTANRIIHTYCSLTHR